MYTVQEHRGIVAYPRAPGDYTCVYAMSGSREGGGP